MTRLCIFVVFCPFWCRSLLSCLRMTLQIRFWCWCPQCLLHFDAPNMYALLISFASPAAMSLSPQCGVWWLLLSSPDDWTLALKRSCRHLTVAVLKSVVDNSPQCSAWWQFLGLQDNWTLAQTFLSIFFSCSFKKCSRRCVRKISVLVVYWRCKRRFLWKK